MEKTMDEQKDVTEMTVDIVTAFVGNNSLPAAELPSLIANIHRALSGLAGGEAPKSAEPAATSGHDQEIHWPRILLFALKDGRKFKSLKRHLRTKYNMSPEDYRVKWSLPKDYPMVAPRLCPSALRARKANGPRSR
ncbi:MAG: MucR family transcriptional regulator [Asticcacaulis sp.]